MISVLKALKITCTTLHCFMFIKHFSHTHTHTHIHTTCQTFPKLFSSDQCFFFTTWAQSYLPRTTVSLTPGRSCVLPPCTSTTLCSWRLCPSPGMNTTASLPLDSRTRAHLRLAELGFFGLRIMVFRITAFNCGRPNVAPSFGGRGAGLPSRCIWFRVAMVLDRMGLDHCA